MPSVRISKELKDQIYFVTFIVKNWYHLFDRHDRFSILEKSFCYCQEHKGLKIYAFVFMLNHLHFIGSVPDIIAVIRDMKKFLLKKFKKNLMATYPNTLRLFETDGNFHFWEDKNMSKLVETEKFLHQKSEYIHMNPVKKQYVHFAEDWRWSSACKIPSKITISYI